MGNGYTRNDTSNNIASGNVINAADLDGEFDAIEAAFVETTGHTHDGSADNGAPITVVGPAQDYVGGASDFSPKTDSTYDLGKTAVRWANGYLDNLNTATATVSGVLTVDLSTVSSTGDLAVADGGTGSSTAAGARTNLGLVIGTDVQAWDTNLDQIAALAVTDGNIIVGNGSAWVAESGATARASLGLTIGTDVQAYSSVLANTTASFTTADETKLDSINEQTSFAPVTVSGTTPTLDLSSGNFFHQVSVSADTTISFSNVPTEARWSYSYTKTPSALYSLINSVYQDQYYFGGSTDIEGILLGDSDTKVYFLQNSNDRIDQATMEVPGEVSSINRQYNNFTSSPLVSAQTSSPQAFFIKPDGTKVYILSTTDVYQYSLSTAWDISTLSYDSVSVSVSAQDTTNTGIYFKSDGTKMYLLGQQNDNVYQYSLSTAWDVSTATYDSVSDAVTSPSLSPLFFDSTGDNYFYLASASTLYKVPLSTAWDLSTAGSPSELLSVASYHPDRATYAFCFDSTGQRLYIQGDLDDSVVYQLSSAQYPSITFPASLVEEPIQPKNTRRNTISMYTLDGGVTVYVEN